MPSHLVLLGALSAAVLFSSGCKTQKPSDQISPSASPTSTMYSGQTLPSQVDRLNGTPYYANSAEMAAVAKVDGAPFLLIAPQNPTQALLVVESGSSPSDVTGRPSELSDFSGVTNTLDLPELAKFVKDDVGLDLKKDESGKIVVLKVQRPSGGGSTSSSDTNQKSSSTQTPASGARP